MDQVPSSPARSQALIYDGRLGELYGIFLLNILFTVLTLGIWRFWAITRYRRYFWSHTQFGGERFEYTGKGGELFVGFLLAGLVLVGSVAVAFGLAFVLGMIWPPLAVLPIVLLYGLVIVLAAGAVFSAQRYRLTRTVWRGIRGGMTGSMLRYGLAAVLYTLAAAFTLMQLLPWAQVRLAERRINASNFGSSRFAFQGQAGQLYGAFLLTFLAAAALFAAIAMAEWVVLQSLLPVIFNHSGAVAAPELPPGLALALVGGMLAFSIGAGLIGCWFRALFERHVVGRTTLGPLQFSSTMSGTGLLGLVVGNLLILLFTLGLGFPVVLHRNATFLARTLWVSGSLDLVALTQSTTGAARFGEGMFQQLDGGGIL